VTASPVLRFGTRGSALARAQTDLVIDRLKNLHAEIQCEVVVIQTEGDRDKESPLTVIGGRGVFTNALQDALRRGEIDVAVHSAKDLPTEEAPDLKIAAFLERADPRDVFISKHGLPLADLGPNPVIGTSSRRRQVQVRKLRPDAQLVDLRGNIDTRLRKAFETDLDGIVVAAAGIERMGWSDRITDYLPLDIAVPSPGQGALAVEIRTNDSGLASLLVDLNDEDVSTAVKTERAFLRAMGGGCTSPVGAFATNSREFVLLRAMVGNEDGSRVLWLEELIPVSEARSCAESRSREMLAQLQNPSSLEDKRLLVTRSDPNDRLVRDLRARGAATIVVAVTRIEPVDPKMIEAELGKLGDKILDWVAFTSQNAVDAFLNCEQAVKLTAQSSIAAVGGVTSQKLRDRGIEVAIQPTSFSAEALVDELAQRGVAGKRVLFPHGNLARNTLPDGLRAKGAKVETVEVYRTIDADAIDPVYLRAISALPIDAAIFCSPSAVNSLTKLLGIKADVLKQMTIACIGPTTAEAARSAGLDVEVMPDEATIEALINELDKHFAKGFDQENELVAASHAGEGNDANDR
jgi:hydroxymethylbilane synthase